MIRLRLQTSGTSIGHRDQYSGGYNNSMDVWLRTQGLTMESKVYAKVGNDDVGVGGATVTLSKVERRR